MDGFQLLLLIAIIVAGYFMLSNRRKQGAGAAPVSKPLVLQNVEAGGLVSLRGVGPDLEDFDVSILGRHTYDEDGFSWFELEGDAGTRKVWIEVEEDDELEVSVSLRQESLTALGLTPEQLKQIRQNSVGKISFEGVTYEFDESGKATFYRQNATSPLGERLRYWDFLAPDHQSGISIERWGEDEYQCHLYQLLKPSQYTVYSLNGGEAA
ncbi:DUF4178 domain-containing protein [Magnetofaba australis]|uniref:DUF4178 domain-containing protein n=1 Tax=Magnetofaba australis IT-1 TaxID=1434232 RepID=A0A1Y2KB38_9PROT|nr:DUF4178 domain-containing protein [Magnetofaba australis]OSM07144.1 hypothetical protein MAIT1_03941 [Magnetofaba australis IT-1]